MSRAHKHRLQLALGDPADAGFYLQSGKPKFTIISAREKKELARRHYLARPRIRPMP
jgi:hypothetical protein